jgi:hypothetical protein
LIVYSLQSPASAHARISLIFALTSSVNTASISMYISASPPDISNPFFVSTPAILISAGASGSSAACPARPNASGGIRGFFCLCFGIHFSSTAFSIIVSIGLKI